MTMRWTFRRGLAALVGSTALAMASATAIAAGSYLPSADDVVLERLVIARSASEAMRSLRGLRVALSERPDDPQRAATFARRAIELGREESDPRFFGYAESALQPWWAQATPPAELRLLRATLRQQRHDFAGARADLDALIAVEGGDAQARLTRAVVLMVQGEPRAALHDCTALIGHAGLLTATTCIVQAKSLMGQGAVAGAALEAVLDAPSSDGTTAERSWSLTVAAELAGRRGDIATASRRFDQARAMVVAGAQHDPYLDTADADFLLSQRRYEDVRLRLAGDTRIDNALLRLALAEQALGDPALDGHVRLLQARFDDTRQRGDTVHLREESMFELLIRKDAARALALATQNWQTQREPIDARLLIDAALAAQQPQRAAPVVAWIRDTGIDDPALLERLGQLKAAGFSA